MCDDVRRVAEMIRRKEKIEAELRAYLAGLGMEPIDMESAAYNLDRNEEDRELTSQIMHAVRCSVHRAVLERAHANRRADVAELRAGANE